MIKSLKRAIKDFNYGLSKEMFGDRTPQMPTFGKKDNYNDLKLMDNVKSISKGKVIRWIKLLRKWLSKIFKVIKNLT